MPIQRPTRLPLGRSPRRLSFERRLAMALTLLSLPGLIATGSLTWILTSSFSATLLAVLALGVVWMFASVTLTQQIIRPMQTLANVVAALREDDFSFRARGARRGDAVGDLALEINALAATLQHQRASALDALTLVERVLTAMPSPVLAFDQAGNLQLVNQAASNALHLPVNAVSRSAEELALAPLLHLPDRATFCPATMRWSVRRANFRLQGLPHTLFVLTDVAAALREEERLAWQRLIRVLSHEINNSLTPIQSVAGSLRTRLRMPAPSLEDLTRGLTLIEERATSLNRFLQAYQTLARLPAPQLRPTQIEPLLLQVAELETRLAVTLVPGPAVTVSCDPDQIQQALINLIRNAADAALANPERPAAVRLTWSVADCLTIEIVDTGQGVASTANLFVPFYTTKPQGSGIGLTLVQQIAAAHNGAVTLRSNPGAPGCTAALTLPL